MVLLASIWMDRFFPGSLKLGAFKTITRIPQTHQVALRFPLSELRRHKYGRAHLLGMTYVVTGHGEKIVLASSLVTLRTLCIISSFRVYGDGTTAWARRRCSALLSHIE